MEYTRANLWHSQCESNTIIMRNAFIHKVVPTSDAGRSHGAKDRTVPHDSETDGVKMAAN